MGLSNRTVLRSQLIAWLSLTVVGVVCVFIYAPSWVASIIGAPAFLWLSILAYGTIRKCRGALPFNEGEQRAAARSCGGSGHHITTADGRIVEYIVYGSDRDDAQVMVDWIQAACKMRDELGYQTLGAI